MTRQEIQDEVIRYLAEDSDPKYWSTADIHQYINDGLREFNYKTMQSTTVSNVSLVSKNLYTIPTDCQWIINGWYDDTYECKPDEDQIYAQRNNDDSGTPRKIVRDMRQGHNKYRLWPKPSDISETFELVYANIPSNITTNQSPPFRKPHTALVYYTLYRCFDEEGRTQDDGKAQKFLRKYMDECNKTGQNEIGPIVRETKPWGPEYGYEHYDSDDYHF
jgi:hypothetical protein